MIKKIKDKLYILVSWKKILFDYPKLHIGLVDYDQYWKDKRGNDIGALSDWQIERAQFVVDKLKNEKNITILDIACGDGSILNYINERISVSKMTGTDISTFALERANKFGVETHILDIGKVQELVSIPTADYILMFEILEHVPHSEKLLQMAYEKAKKGVFFSFPNTGFLLIDSVYFLVSFQCSGDYFLENTYAIGQRQTYFGG